MLRNIDLEPETWHVMGLVLLCSMCGVIIAALTSFFIPNF